MNTVNVQSGRLASIDIFRAVTMLTMIFVNDFWTLEEVPLWMEHSAAKADAMGLSDVVFPAFLFIVGLSIPYAIGNRQAKGDNWVPILTHIFERTFALLVMGIFIVNYENILSAGFISNNIWEIAMVIAFLLIWNAYPQNPGRERLYLYFKIGGYALLLMLGYIYKSGDPLDPTGMETRWWGILGLIGWSYFLCAPIFLFIGDRLNLILGAWLFFVLFNLLEFAGVLNFLHGVKWYIWIVGSGSMPAFTMAGISASVFYRTYGQKITAEKFAQVLVVIGLLAFIYGFGTRPFWGISKIRATPAWVGICTGISFMLFALFFWIADINKKRAWADSIKPAGTATLTCYLVPYIGYALITILGISLPLCLRIGVIGISKSFLFALFVILLTGVINRKGIKLKI
jgi:heparan-alpha-glucosaminide N-acetyltransferase